MTQRRRDRRGYRWTGRALSLTLFSALFAVLVGTPPASASSGEPARASASAADTVEAHFAAPGPWAWSRRTADVPAAGGVTIFHPTDLGAGGTDHPIITWGNGTGATPDQAATMLRHYASWGFVVVASNDPNVGEGTEMLAAAELAQNGEPSSIFHGHLDTSKVGAVGASQGAGGAVNATLLSDGLIRSTATMSLPDSWWWTTPVPNLGPITTPVFFARGQNDPVSIESEALRWYGEVSGPAAKASLRGVAHAFPDTYNGYITAWFVYTLQGDTFARGAFVGNPPEINADADWADQAQKGLT